MSDSWPRRRLLAILRGASEPLDAQQLAQVTGQHVTTVRFHLDILTRESLVRQFQQPPRGRGRPRIGYRAVQRTMGYQDLAQALADQLGPGPQEQAAAGLAAGRAWGGKLDTSEEPIESVREAKDRVVSLMSELGFAPERDTRDVSGRDPEEGVVVRLTACPLRDLARTHTEVVCGVHRGLLDALLERGGAAGRIEAELRPFVAEETCEVLLRRVPATERSRTEQPVSATRVAAGQGRIDPAAGQAARMSRVSGQVVPPGSQLPPASASVDGEPRPASGPLTPAAGQQGGRVLRGAPPSGMAGPQLRDTDAHFLEQSAKQW
ncbi:transcriptional regulator [Nocardia sp. NPDC024068]|uniref:helix-turn-helix transcriptional regulator n=1 Tax=Nocardia sp. NPDC024068 TaxID=3157197 RepID=UPI0033C50C06